MLNGIAQAVQENLPDNTTDKILLVVVLLATLFAGVYTQNPVLFDAFKVGLGAAIVALASRIERKA